jgi:hypothetical protein
MTVAPPAKDSTVAPPIEDSAYEVLDPRSFMISNPLQNIEIHQLLGAGNFGKAGHFLS